MPSRTAMAEIVGPAPPAESNPAGCGHCCALITVATVTGPPSGAAAAGPGGRSCARRGADGACLPRPGALPGHVAELALQAPPLRLRDHLALPFTAVLAADVGVHGHAPDPRVSRYGRVKCRPLMWRGAGPAARRPVVCGWARRGVILGAGGGITAGRGPGAEAESDGRVYVHA